MSTNETITSETDSDTVSIIPTAGLAKFAAGPSDVRGLIVLASDIDLKFGTFAKKISGLQTEVTTRADKITADIDRFTDLPKNQRQQMASQEIGRQRRELVQGSDEDRFKTLRELKAADDQMTAIESQFATPAHLLMRAGLGSEERSRYISQIANSGPLELQNYAAHAVATDDKVLGAAILTKLDSMNKRDRELSGISRQEIAEALAGQDFKKAMNAIQIVKNRVRQAFNLNRSFESGKSNARERIGIALAKRNETSALDDEGQDDE